MLAVDVVELCHYFFVPLLSLQAVTLFTTCLPPSAGPPPVVVVPQQCSVFMMFNVDVVHSGRINSIFVAVHTKVLFQRHGLFVVVELILFLLMFMQRCYFTVIN